LLPRHLAERGRGNQLSSYRERSAKVLKVLFVENPRHVRRLCGKIGSAIFLGKNAVTPAREKFYLAKEDGGFSFRVKRSAGCLRGSLFILQYLMSLLLSIVVAGQINPDWYSLQANQM
jgi:hypothetical protein